MARSTAWGSTASLSGAGAGARGGGVVPHPAITNMVAAATDRRPIIMVCTARSSSDSLPRPSVGTLLLGCEQLLVRRVVAQRPHGQGEGDHPPARVTPRGRPPVPPEPRGTLPPNPPGPGPPHPVAAPP